MTFILSCATSDAVYQVSDRRVTTLSGPNPGAVIDDESNKAVVIDGRVAFSYTGLAEIEGNRTDDWLATRFGHVQTNDLGAVAERIRSSASNAFKRIRVADRRWLRHAFVGVGWARPRDVPGPIPVLLTISNALDPAGEWESQPRTEFSFVVNRWWETKGGFSIATAGQTLSAAEKKVMWRHMRRAIKRGQGRRAILHAMILACRWAATRYTGVGPSLMAMCIPKAGAVSIMETGQVMMLLSNDPEGDIPTFYYAPPDSPTTFYGPHFVTGGAVMTNFTVTPLPPARIASPAPPDEGERQNPSS